MYPRSLSRLVLNKSVISLFVSPQTSSLIHVQSMGFSKSFSKTTSLLLQVFSPSVWQWFSIPCHIRKFLLQCIFFVANEDFLNTLFSFGKYISLFQRVFWLYCHILSTLLLHFPHCSILVSVIRNSHLQLSFLLIGVHACFLLLMFTPYLFYFNSFCRKTVVFFQSAINMAIFLYVILFPASLNNNNNKMECVVWNLWIYCMIC